MSRRCLVPIALLAATLHGIGLARSTLPAQDGLKFLRVARQFHARRWVDVVRSSDQHPLYPAAIALAQPVVARFVRPDAESWRIAAGWVSALASVAILFPLFGLAKSLFNAPTGAMAALLYVLLPLPAEVGHDTLGDPLALLFFAWSMRLGEVSLRTKRPLAAVGCGIMAGVGFLARPEVALVPLCVLIAAALRSLPRPSGLPLPAASWRFAAMAIGLFGVVGLYATVKGEVSEKLSLRRFAAISSKHDAPAKPPRTTLPGLDDPRWDFSAKEESGHASRLDFALAAARFAWKWAEAMGWLLVPLALWGAYRVPSGPGGRLVAVYLAVFGFVLIRHAMSLGYLSSRHVLSMVVVAIPWAAAGLLAIAASLRARLSVEHAREALGRRVLAVASMVALGVGVQLHHAPHAGRWGHGQAGRWLASHASATDKVLDTRGWAAFVSGRVGLDYWHVRQALADPDLAFLVVGDDEVKAASRRAGTLRALLAFAAEPVAEFPDREGGPAPGVLVYRFRRPADWRAMRP